MTDKTGVINALSDFLENSEFNSNIGEHGQINFQKETRNYMLLVDVSDVILYQLFFTRFYPLTDDSELPRIFAAIALVFENVKATKIRVINNELWGSVDGFCVSAEHFQIIFPRLLEALHGGVSLFQQEMKAT